MIYGLTIINQQALYIPMTSELSGSCQNAAMLAEDFDGRVYVVDNRRISVTQRGAVLEAKHMADAGYLPEEIKSYLEASAFQASIYLTVADLEYLQRGGRLSSSAALLGTLLNIKPILSIQGYQIDVFSKVRGLKACEKKMIEAVQNDISTRFADVPVEKLRIEAGGTQRNQEGSLAVDGSGGVPGCGSGVRDTSVQYCQPCWTGLCGDGCFCQ